MNMSCNTYARAFYMIMCISYDRSFLYNSRYGYDNSVIIQTQHPIKMLKI